MPELVLMGVAAVVVVVVVWTLRVVMRDDPGRRPTREFYDTRRPE